MAKATWKQLRVNDWIVCPKSGLPEQVIASHRYTATRWFVRTNHHDHLRPVGQVVERTADPRPSKEIR